MKLLFDFLPIVIFFGVYKYTDDIVTATAILIPATLVQVAIIWLKTRRLEKMHLITLALVILLGGATVLFNDKTFIQWKPTIVNWLFAAIFLGSQFIGGKTLVQRMMESNLQLPQKIWNHLNYGWVAFFLIMGALNLYVFTYFSEETWVNFKLFGMLGLTLLFIVLQGIYLARHLKQHELHSSDHSQGD